MLAVDCPELNRIIRQEAERDKARANHGGKRGISVRRRLRSQGDEPWKKIFYAIMRVLVIPLRRFL